MRDLLKRTLSALVLIIIFTACNQPVQEVCLCRYGVYKPIDRYHSVVGVYQLSGDFTILEKFLHSKHETVFSLSKEEIDPMFYLIERLQNDDYKAYSKNDHAILEKMRKFKNMEIIVYAREKKHTMEATGEDYYFVEVASFDLKSHCVSYYHSEFFPPEETFESKLIDEIQRDYQ